MTQFSDKQMAAMATLTLVYPAGISLAEDRTDDIATLDSLVESGHVVTISGHFDGDGYRLSPAMAEAHRQLISNGADQAAQN